MEKPIVCVDPESGEIIPNWEIRWTGPVYNPEQFCLYVNVNGKSIRLENVGFYEKKQEQKIREATHPLFGEYIPLPNKGRYSKVYEIPLFSSNLYSTFWIIIERSLEKDTGAICYRYKNGNLKRVQSINDWKRLLKAHPKTIQKFLKEAMDKEYIKRCESKTLCWIANPAFIWNGTLIPISILKLFQSAV